MNTFTLVAGVVAAFLLLYIQVLQDRRGNTCNAPCVVHFDKPMAEDNFKIDYQHQVVKVWKVNP